MNYSVQMFTKASGKWVNVVEDICSADLDHIKQTLNCRPFPYRIVNTIQNKVEWRNYVKR